MAFYAGGVIPSEFWPASSFAASLGPFPWEHCDVFGGPFLAVLRRVTFARFKFCQYGGAVHGCQDPRDTGRNIA